eukprot:TRINITY_DN6570_c0_g1_i1.p1 TRINITY_DN6570_c0_g1~~TRINITY_DN6570_c0_g1_i1.p1  ORF type:complete len:172 (-),score=25.22 TRINITY_DN6570_c0_g1_i1:88-603(-)
MVLQAVVVKAELENVDKVTCPKNNQWSLKLSCSNCGEVTEKWVVFSTEDQNPTGAKGISNFVAKCKGCRRENSIDITSPTDYSFPIDENNQNKYAPIGTFECRGLEITEYQPRDGFLVTAPTGSKWEDVDLSEDWNEYDEKGQCSVGVMSYTHKIVSFKSLATLMKEIKDL